MEVTLEGASGGSGGNGIKTRSENYVWLIGQTSETIAGSKLPSKQQILANFFHHHLVAKQTIHQSATNCVRAAMIFWKKARIPTTEEYNAITKLEKLVDRYKQIKKHKKRTSITQKTREEVFQKELVELFDIAHANALELIKIKEDRDFLMDQRSARIGYMAGVDQLLSRKEENIAQRQEMYLQRTQKEKLRLEDSQNVEDDARYERFESSSSSTGNTSDEDNGAIDIFMPKTKRHKKTHALVTVVSPELASVLDRTKTSDRDATYAIAATAQSLGHNTEELALSRSTVRRQRMKNREQTMLNANQMIQFKGPLIIIIIHWDGKLMEDFAVGKSVKVDRLPILVTGVDTEKLLGVPKIMRGTGEAMAEATIEAMQDWGIRPEHIAGLCFDTTSSNTGKYRGACTLIEQKMQKRLLHFACRHHIYEVILGDVFKSCFGPSTGPDVLLFKRFQDKWQFIDQAAFKCCTDDDNTLRMMQESPMKELKENAITFAMAQLKAEKKQPRDYREFLELTVIFLGNIPPRGNRFMQPGAFHHARWMAKTIYCIKIWMFHEQFKLTAREKTALLAFSLFSTLLYMRAWFSCPLSTEAPVNDLAFLKVLKDYTGVDSRIAQTAERAIKRHLWYLSEELVMLSLFSDTVSNETKAKMVKGLRKEPADTPPKKRLDGTILKDIHCKSLDELVIANSMLLIQSLGIKCEFLEQHPSSWEESDSYKEGKMIVKMITVVNDTAERGVSLMAEYNTALTKNEEQKQFLLQVVKEHREKFSSAKKSLFIEAAAAAGMRDSSDSE